MKQPPLKPKLQDFEWLDGQDVMQILNISPKTLQNWRRRGIIVYSSLGGKLFYNLSEIKQSLIENNQPKK